MKSAIPVSLLLAAAISLSLSQQASAQPIFLSALAVSDDAASGSTIPSDQPAKKQFLIGPEFSVFFPTSSNTTNVYGKSWGSIGVGFGSTIHAREKGDISPYIDVLYNSHNGNHAFLLPLGVSYRKALSASTTSPYYGLQAYVLPVQQSAPDFGVKSGWNVGVGARASVGIQFSKYVYVEAGYLENTSVRSFNFSGTELLAGIRI